jgi:hypothetical protein
MGFQKQANLTPAPAVAGDFASANARASVLAGPGGLVAGIGGVTVGRFAWVDPVDGATTYGRGASGSAPNGFVHREQQALISAFLAESGNLIPQGMPVTLSNEGDFWATVTGATAATVGASVYATYADGTITVGSASANATATGSIGATFTATGSGANLTTSAVTGLISVGDSVAGTGVPVGTTIVSQTSGTPGGAGVYVTSLATTISAATGTAFGTVMNVTAVGSGSLDIGESVTGTGVPAGAVIASQISGATGGVGVYRLSVAAAAYAASTALTSVGGVLTNFVCRSVAAVGELVKISTWGK